jgi:hypothetical protein
MSRKIAELKKTDPVRKHPYTIKRVLSEKIIC